MMLLLAQHYNPCEIHIQELNDALLIFYLLIAPLPAGGLYLS